MSLPEATALTSDQELQAALHQTQAELREAQRLGHVGSWELDLIGNALKWSEATSCIFGRDPGEPLTRESFDVAVHPEDREAVRQKLAEAVEGRNPFQIEHRIIRPDGARRWVRTRGEAVLGPDQQPIRLVGTVQDLTECRLLEEQLRQAQKMESIWLLSAGVAHDFNNLLTVIRGQAENTLVHEALSGQGIEALNQVIQASERAADLTRQLLTFSRKQPSQLQPLDLNTVITGLSKMLRRVIGQEIELCLHLAASLPPVQADPGVIEQILMDLAVNARDAMEQGGALSMATESVVLDSEAPARFPKARPGPFVRLTVQDTGAGIAPAVLPRIFEPFFTTKERGSGTGLGLITVANIVERYHGWIEVETEWGRGTVFKIYLPARPDLKREAPAAAPMKTLPGGSERILLVEDDPALRRFLLLFLERLGYRVQAALTTQEAAGVWQSGDAEFDLLLTDAVTPSGLHGWALARQLRQQKPGLKVAIMANSGKAPLGHEPLPGEYFSVLAKPFTPQALAQALRDCLDDR